MQKEVISKSPRIIRAEFKVAEKDGQVGFYDTLTPLYTSFHEDDQAFSLMWTEYDESFPVFYQSYLDGQKRCADNHGVLARPGEVPPENAYTVSCVPCISFHNFAVHSYENKPFYFPSVEAGKFFQQQGRILMPLSITCHYAATDGYHVKCFLDTLQQDADRFREFLT